MQILLANAKIMFDNSRISPWSCPLFQSTANEIALEMSSYDIDKLSEELDCSKKIAAENWKRYQNFFITDKIPAILAYNGQAYKHLKAGTLSEDALRFAQEHLWITCFLYGLLRPMDGIVPYRMEHCVHLDLADGRPVNQFWKDKLTDLLIESVKTDDGILIHLSTEEYEHLFDWKRVCNEISVIHPLFYVRQTDRSLKMQAVWAKSCRGAIIRYIIENQLTNTEELNKFYYEGFTFQPQLGEEKCPHFVRDNTK